MAYYGRGKNRIQNPYTLLDMYKDYISSVDTGSPYDVSCEEYMKICNLFYQALIDYLFLNNGKWVLPYNIGSMSVRKRKINVNKDELSPDWKMTTEHGKMIYHLNEHSSGYMYRLNWEKWNHIQKNKGLYNFILTRTNKRRLAKLIKSGKYDYFELF
jgi:hypothetical protein